MTPSKLPYQHLMRLQLDVDSARSLPIGMTNRGRRTIAPIKGGHFEGALLSGEVLPGGADWVIIRSDGVMKIDVRLCLKTDQGAHIYLNYKGQFIAEPEDLQALASGEELPSDSYSLTVTAKLETGDEALCWLEDAIVVGTGKQSGFNPTYDFYVIGRRS